MNVHLKQSHLVWSNAEMQAKPSLMVSPMGHVNSEKWKRLWYLKKRGDLSQILYFSIQIERKIVLASVFGPSQSAI